MKNIIDNIYEDEENYYEVTDKIRFKKYYSN